MIRRRRRGCRQLLDDLKEARRYWKLREGTLWRTRFGRGYGPVVRQSDNEFYVSCYVEVYIFSRLPEISAFH
jgi:hypothetical protein